VLEDAGRIRKFITSGISDEARRSIGSPPEGHGLLGVLMHEGGSLRLDDLKSDRRSAGFPGNHPPMTSLLGVPVFSGGSLIGNLYLTDKLDGAPFDERDEEMLRLLSSQAAVAIHNARLHDRLESLARLEERERIAMDLHDGVIQSIYATTLRLEDVSGSLSAEDSGLQPAVESAIDDLGQVIKDIRSYIFDLRPQVSEVKDLPHAIQQLANNLRVNSLIPVTVEISEPLTGISTPEQALGIFHITQEALSNISKHAKATSASIRLISRERDVVLDIADNGVGFAVDDEGSTAKHGMRNMRDRARSLGAEWEVSSYPRGGTTITVRIPVRS
jgi:signal transduction histidine kinase